MDLHLDGITNVTANQIAPRRDDNQASWSLGNRLGVANRAAYKSYRLYFVS